MKRLAFALFFAVACSSTSESVAPEVDSAAVDSASADDTGGADTLTDSSGEDVALDSFLADSLADSATDAPADVGFGPYPPGPYGNKLGDVMANLVWEGYENDLADAISNTKPYVASVSMDDLRKKATKGYALVHVSEFY